MIVLRAGLVALKGSTMLTAQGRVLLAIIVHPAAPAVTRNPVLLAVMEQQRGFATPFVQAHARRHLIAHWAQPASNLSSRASTRPYTRQK